LTGTDLRSAQLTDIDGDGFVDLALEGVRWIRNDGHMPYLENSEEQDLNVPLADPNRAAYAEVEALEDLCGVGNGILTWLWGEAIVHNHITPPGVPTYEYPWEYWAGQSRFADVNGDGVA